MEKKLRDILLKFRDSDNFVRGVMNLLKTDEDKQEMIDAINNGYVNDPSDILLYALSIYDDLPFEESDDEE